MKKYYSPFFNNFLGTVLAALPFHYSRADLQQLPNEWDSVNEQELLIDSSHIKKKSKLGHFVNKRQSPSSQSKYFNQSYLQSIDIDPKDEYVKTIPKENDQTDDLVAVETPPEFTPQINLNAANRAGNFSPIETIPRRENVREKPISINFNNINVVEFIRYFSKIANKNFYFDESELNFNITIISEEMTTIENVMTALLQELRIHEFSMLEQGDNIIIHRNPSVQAPGTIRADSLPETLLKDADIVTQVFRLNTANATSVSQMIQPLLSASSIITVLEETNHIIVTDLQANIKKIGQLIKSIDAPNSSLIIGQYVVRNAFIDTLIQNAEQIMQSVAPGQSINFIAHMPSNSVFIVSTPFLVERAIPVLQRLDQTDATTGIYNLDELKYISPEVLQQRARAGEGQIEIGPDGQLRYRTGPDRGRAVRGSWKLDKNGNWYYEPSEDVSRLVNYQGNIKSFGGGISNQYDPDKIRFNPDGSVSNPEVLRNFSGGLSTEFDPNVIYYNSDGTVAREFSPNKIYYNADGSVARVVNPVVIYYNADGTVARTYEPNKIYYHADGTVVRDFDPNLVYYNTDGTIFKQANPDIIRYNPDGSIANPEALQRIAGQISPYYLTHPIRFNPDGSIMNPENIPGAVNSDKPPEGFWRQGPDGSWEFSPRFAPLREGEIDTSKKPAGFWQQDENGKWIFMLSPGETIFSNKESRPFLPSEGLPLGHIERTKFLIHKLNYRLGDTIEEALIKIADSLRLTESVNHDLVAALQSVQWLEASNSIVVTGSPGSLLKVKELIEEIDQPLRQVFIEMLILETTVDDSLTYTVNMGSSFRGDDGNIAGTQAFLTASSPLGAILGSAGPNGTSSANVQGRFPNPTSVSSSFPNATPVAGSDGYSLGIVGQKISMGGIEFDSLAAFVKAVHGKSETNVIMNPKIMTEDNVTAEIFVGENTPYQTQSIANNEGAILTNNYEYRDIGTSLRVTPLLGPSNMITLQIEEELSRVLGTLTNQGIIDTTLGPTTRINRTSTQVHIPDGYFLIISGMMQDETTNRRSHIPCLGGAPLIGAAFSSKTYADAKRCLMIFIRPKLIDTEAQIDNLTRHQQNIFRLKRRTKKMWKLDTEEALDWLNLTDTNPINDESRCCDFKY